MYIGFHVRYPNSCKILMTLDFSQQIFEKSSNIKFHKNLSSGSWVVPWECMDQATDRHNEANSRFSQFCDCATTV